MKKYLLPYEDENGHLQYETCQEQELDQIDILQYTGIFEVSDRAYWAFQDLLNR